MSASNTKQAKKALTSALDTLSKLDSTKFSKKDINEIASLFEGELGSEAMIAASRVAVAQVSKLAYDIGKSEVLTALGTKLAFGKQDVKSLALIEKTNPFWVGGSWNSYTNKAIKNSLRPYLETSINRSELARKLAQNFAGSLELPPHYWNMLSSHLVAKTREISRVASYEQAGVEYVQIKARLDDKTSLVCRHMNGRIISVSSMRRQVDNYLSASEDRGFDKAKSSWKMYTSNNNLANTPTLSLGSGTASPPYHLNCRTITVAYFSDTPPTHIKPNKNSFASPTVASGEINKMKSKVVNREKFTKFETEWLKSEARKIDEWGDLKGHYQKHSQEVVALREKHYHQMALEPIHNPKSSFYTSVRGGRLNGTFALPYKSKKGETKYKTASVDFERKRILTYYKRPKINMLNINDEVPNMLQKMMGWFQ